MIRTEEKLFGLLNENGMKICFAESCTGGLVAERLVGVSGSSAVFDGAMCSYANAVKEKLLGVKPCVLEKRGAVSADCALQMAKGALALFGADIAVSTTGIAGPTGGTAEKPVGTVYICCAKKTGESYIWRYRFTGDRQTVREKAAEEALQMAILAINHG